MRQLTDPTWINVKGMLFLLLGFLSAAVLILEHPSFKMAFLLAVAVWSFCRFYYFAFYVIQHYVDPTYRFASLLSFAFHMFGKRRSNPSAKHAQ
jgi:hypothetical protein